MRTIDADDFSKDAVDCFIEACYTGRVDELNRGNFRDVNKMSHAFEVGWMGENCKDYFKKLVQTFSRYYMENMIDVLFAVNEALYVAKALKQYHFYDIVVETLVSFSILDKNRFIGQFLVNISSATKLQLDFCLTVVDDDVYVLAKLLEKHLEEIGHGSLDENWRYILYSIGSNLYSDEKSFVASDMLFDLLENFEGCTNEDCKLLVYLYKQKYKQHQKNMSSSPLTLTSYQDYFDRCNKFLVDKLGTSSEVDSLYSLFDGLWLAEINNAHSLSCYKTEHLQDIINIKKKRGWGKISFSYLNRVYAGFSRCRDLVELIKGCNELVDRETEVKSTTICEYPASEFRETIFCSCKSFTFSLDGEHFELSIQATANYTRPDDFCAKWFSSGQKRNLHFALEVDQIYYMRGVERHNWHMVPLTWFGPPTCYNNGREWNWGNVHFFDWSSKKLENKRPYLIQIDLNVWLRMTKFICPREDTSLTVMRTSSSYLTVKSAVLSLLRSISCQL